jgi:2-polyprenyl-3-methyl-5-hydroxy-6-metoxy-1,4-benzoquinol methylase
MEDRVKNHCIICGSNYKKSQRNGLVECERCHFITSDGYLSDEELRNLYRGSYFCRGEYADYLSDREIIQRNLKARLDVLLRFVEQTEKKKLFEIGCAYGFFLDLARGRFERVFGIDISCEAVKYSKEVLHLDAMAGDYLSDKMEGNYDVCCMWDTIEHLKEPHLFIEKIASEMNRDGILAVTTGDIGSLNARLRGKKWRQIRPPVHLHYFSGKTLIRLLERNGFQVVYVAHPGSYLSLRNILHIILVARNRSPNLYRWLDHAGLLKSNVYLNMFDLLYVIGRKR